MRFLGVVWLVCALLPWWYGEREHLSYALERSRDL